MNKELTTVEKKSKRKLVIALISIALIAVFTGGIIAAYYSDYFQNSGNLTTNTLSINVDHKVYLNGSETTLESISGLNPGDVIVIKGSISNSGSQSAWIRETIKFTPSASLLIPYLKVYNIEIAQNDLLAGGQFADNAVSVSGEGLAAVGNKVIDGTSESAQQKSSGDYAYIGATSYNFALTIFFSTDAGNETQNQNIGVQFAVQALQFANNNTALPSWTAV